MTIWKKVIDFIKSFFNKKIPPPPPPPYIPQLNRSEWFLPELKLLEDVNVYRSEAGLSELKPEKFIRVQAQSRTTFYSSLGKATHHNIGIIDKNIINAGFEYVYENAAYGYATVGSLFKAFKASKLHNETMLRKDAQYIGISIRFDDKKMYCCLLIVK